MLYTASLYLGLQSVIWLGTLGNLAVLLVWHCSRYEQPASNYVCIDADVLDLLLSQVVVRACQ